MGAIEECKIWLDRIWEWHSKITDKVNHLDDRVKALEASAGRSIPYGPGPIQPIILKYNPPQPAQDEALESQVKDIIARWPNQSISLSDLARKIIAAVRAS